MHRAWHLLLILTVLWCGLHGAGHAEAATDATDVTIVSHEADPHGSGDEPGDPHGNTRHACHHHCPLAANLGFAQADGMRRMGPVTFPPSVSVLRSLSQAPPLQPPSA